MHKSRGDHVGRETTIRLPPVVLDMFSSTPDDTLSPAAYEDALFALSYNLRFGLTGNPHERTDHARLAGSVVYSEDSPWITQTETQAPAQAPMIMIVRC